MLAKLDEFGAVAWLAVTAVAALIAWPLGLATFAYLAGSGRLYAWRDERSRTPGTWFNLGVRSSSATHDNGRYSSRLRPSGNQAFDTYRADAISQLEEEEREFQSFLERLCQARDKAEFDAFMADRRQRPASKDASGPSGKPE